MKQFRTILLFLFYLTICFIVTMAAVNWVNSK